VAFIRAKRPSLILSAAFRNICSLELATVFKKDPGKRFEKAGYIV